MSEANGGKKSWGLVLGLAGLGLLALAGWWLRPAYRQFKERRSLQLAQQFFAAADYRNGLLSLRQTLVLNPQNLTAVRLMADFATQSLSPAALGWWRRAVELAPTPENKFLLTAAALRLEPPPFPIAAAMIQEFTTAGLTNLEYHLLASQLALKLNQADAAESHLAAAARLEPTNRLHQLNLATLRLQSRDSRVAEAARQELIRIAAEPGCGPPAWRALVADAIQRTNAPAALAFSRQLLATTNATFVDRLQDLTAAALGKDGSFSSQLKRMQKASCSNALEVVQLALWLQSHQQARQALEWLAGLDSRVRESAPVALVEAECFVAAHDWAGLERRLSDRKWEDQDSFRFAYLARALREQGRSATANANWDRAIGAALGRSERVAALVQLALNWGWNDEGIALLWQMARRPGSEEWPLQNLLRIYAARNDSAGMQRVHAELWRRHPDSLPIKNNYAMLSLLTRNDLPQAVRLAKEVYAASPTNGIFASTYALALHLEQHSAEGFRILQALSPAEQNRPEVVPYFALLQAAVGNPSAARELMQHASPHSWLPEEQKLFAPLRN